MGTHIAISISPLFTAAHFARELENEHLKCFPNLGEIRISKLMVKRRSHFYCLPESLPMKYAFQGVKRTRFIHIEASALTSIKKTCLSDSKSKQMAGNMKNDAQVTDRLNPVCRVTSTACGNVSVEPLLPELLPDGRLSKKNRITKRVKKECFPSHLEKGLEDGNLPEEGFTGKERSDIFPDNIADKHRGERSTCSQVETASDTLSVSNIIKKYFNSHDEVTSDSEINSGTIGTSSQQLKPTTYDSFSNIKINATPHWIGAIPRRVTVSPDCTRSRSLVSGNKSKRSKPGKNIVLAFSKLGICSSKQNTNASVCRLRQRKLALQKSTSVVKHLVFEISDDND
ncbi:hypothetical protein POM88_053809 [Heracleum sosnowskyi]|uniref:Uncharacterized protein n=1 Tax=Heracleum sosnowskyi TaxID=360622 RepID=A0AAD8LVI9_9APIA|nr:hypothetical protein POM88_053809 [Heracleum sosnowskyi]